MAMVPERSAVAEIIKQTDSGYVIPSTVDWGTELEKVLRHYLSGRLHQSVNENAIQKYSWDNISKQWIDVIAKAHSFPDH